MVERKKKPSPHNNILLNILIMKERTHSGITIANYGFISLYVGLAKLHNSPKTAIIPDNSYIVRS